MQTVIFEDLGTMPYDQAWEYQRALHQQLVQRKLAIRDRQPPSPQHRQQHYLLFCEHPHVYTLGKSGDMAHLLLSEDALTAKGVTFYKINRGGDITYHGPQQIVGYPIFDLEYFFTDVHRYVRSLEEAIILTLAEYGVVGTRVPDYTGVWVAPDAHHTQWRKICAIGVHLSRWVTMHGFAFNVNTDLQYFDYIVPCGIQEQDKTVTSLAKELGKPVAYEEVKTRLRGKLQDVFGFSYL